MAENWRECKLGDVIELKYGKDHKTLNDGNIPVFGSGGIMRYVDTSLYNDESILIPRKGTLNNIFYINESFWTVDTIFWSKIDTKEVSCKFLFYQLKTIDFANLNVGSAVPSLTTRVLNEIDISLPPLQEQKAIAEILSSLDDKIDLLHRQNHTLESIAQTLFRQWFIEEANPEWEEVKLGDCVQIELGGTPQTSKSEYWNGDIAWINSGEVNRFRITKPTKYITSLGMEKSNTKLLPKGSVVIAITGATLGQVSLLEIDTCANQSVIGVIPNIEFSEEFLYLWIKSNINELILNQTGGAQQHINKNDVSKMKIIKPDKKFLESIKLDYYFQKISHNMLQIQTLENLRDTLLPKLISGEVRVGA